MAIDTKLNLNNNKFTQASGDTLTLSGNTIINGNLEFSSGYTPTGDTSVATKLYIDNNGINNLTFREGVTKDVDNNISLGGTIRNNPNLIGNLSVRGNGFNSTETFPTNYRGMNKQQHHTSTSNFLYHISTINGDIDNPPKLFVFDLSGQTQSEIVTGNTLPPPLSGDNINGLPVALSSIGEHTIIFIEGGAYLYIDDNNQSTLYGSGYTPTSGVTLPSVNSITEQPFFGDQIMYIMDNVFINMYINDVGDILVENTYKNISETNYATLRFNITQDIITVIDSGTTINGSPYPNTGVVGSQIVGKFASDFIDIASLYDSSKVALLLDTNEIYFYDYISNSGFTTQINVVNGEEITISSPILRELFYSSGQFIDEGYVFTYTSNNTIIQNFYNIVNQTIGEPFDFGSSTDYVKVSDLYYVDLLPYTEKNMYRDDITRGEYLLGGSGVDVYSIDVLSTTLRTQQNGVRNTLYEYNDGTKLAISTTNSDITILGSYEATILELNNKGWVYPSNYTADDPNGLITRNIIDTEFGKLSGGDGITLTDKNFELGGLVTSPKNIDARKKLSFTGDMEFSARTTSYSELDFPKVKSLSNLPLQSAKKTTLSGTTYYIFAASSGDTGSFVDNNVQIAIIKDDGVNITESVFANFTTPSGWTANESGIIGNSLVGQMYISERFVFILTGTLTPEKYLIFNLITNEYEDTTSDGNYNLIFQPRPQNYVINSYYNHNFFSNPNSLNEFIMYYIGDVNTFTIINTDTDVNYSKQAGFNVINLTGVGSVVYPDTPINIAPILNGDYDTNLAFVENDVFPLNVDERYGLINISANSLTYIPFNLINSLDFFNSLDGETIEGFHVFEGNQNNYIIYYITNENVYRLATNDNDYTVTPLNNFYGFPQSNNIDQVSNDDYTITLNAIDVNPTEISYELYNRINNEIGTLTLSSGNTIVDFDNLVISGDLPEGVTDVIYFDDVAFTTDNDVFQAFRLTNKTINIGLNDNGFQYPSGYTPTSGGSLITLDYFNSNTEGTSSSIVTSNTTLSSSNDIVYVDNSGSTVTITLPVSPIGNKGYTIKDIGGNANVNAITIDGNGKLIDGNSSIIIESDYAGFNLDYNATKDAWYVIGLI